MSKRNLDEDYVMYIIINADAGMAKGKITSQACHSACHVTRILERQRTIEHGYNKWLSNGETKIVLRATEKEMLDIIQLYSVDSVVKRTSKDPWCVHIRDFGKTQVAPDTLTSIAFKPIHRGTIDVISKMKLL
jgi:peptidyl-tRNA hydrolase